MSKIKRITAASLAREHNIDPRVARRRLRAHVAKDNPVPDTLSPEHLSRKNSKWEWRDNKTNRAKVEAIILTPSEDEVDETPDADETNDNDES